MGRAGRAAAIIALAVTAWACGEDSTSIGGDALKGPDWTLTFLSPDHGAAITGPVEVEVAVTGPAPATGAPREFSFGFFLDGELFVTSAEPTLAMDVPGGTYQLRVDAVDGEGAIVPGVLGDEIQIEVVGSARGGLAL